jgi:hypothetical protein
METYKTSDKEEFRNVLEGYLTHKDKYMYFDSETARECEIDYYTADGYYNTREKELAFSNEDMQNCMTFNDNEFSIVCL